MGDHTTVATGLIMIYPKMHILSVITQLTGIVLTRSLVLSSRDLHGVNSDFSVQEAHGILHHPGVHTLRVSGHAQLDRVLDEAR